MLDASVALSHLALGYLADGQRCPRVSNTNPIASPSEVFDCADGRLIAAVGNSGQFRPCAVCWAATSGAQDARFATNARRVAHRAAARPARAAAVRAR